MLMIPPELVDGDHWTVFDPEDDHTNWIAETLKLYLEEDDPCVGDEVTLKVVEMSREEFEEMPEI